MIAGAQPAHGLAAIQLRRRDVARAVGFHMTDWVADLERLFQFFSDPAALTEDSIEELLYGFLLHVPNHVAAASKLLTGEPVSDIFEVGATDFGG